MAALSKDGLISRLLGYSYAPVKSKKAHAIALKAYKDTNGPTPDLRRVYQAYRDNQAKSGKGSNGRDSAQSDR